MTDAPSPQEKKILLGECIFLIEDFIREHLTTFEEPENREELVQIWNTIVSRVESWVPLPKPDLRDPKLGLLARLLREEIAKVDLLIFEDKNPFSYRNSLRDALATLPNLKASFNGYVNALNEQIRPDQQFPSKKYGQSEEDYRFLILDILAKRLAELEQPEETGVHERMAILNKFISELDNSETVLTSTIIELHRRTRLWFKIPSQEPSEDFAAYRIRLLKILRADVRRLSDML